MDEELSKEERDALEKELAEDNQRLLEGTAMQAFRFVCLHCGKTPQDIGWCEHCGYNRQYEKVRVAPLQ
jgi:uncharacterized protein CbrC (UPF0167 family)